MITSGAIGFAMGVGAAFLAPEVAVAVGVGGLAYGADRLAEHVPGWLHDGAVVANPNNYSPEEVNEAATGIENIRVGWRGCVSWHNWWHRRRLELCSKVVF